MKLRIAVALSLVCLLLIARQPELPTAQPGDIIAYRALTQTNPPVNDNSCGISIISNINSPFIENTIPAINQAFALGAQRVHLNIQATSDGQFAVFHDWTLECKTNGKGVTSQKTMAYLKTLDAGFGYRKATYQFPLRGHGVGLIPSLREVLEQFPTQQFILNPKTVDEKSLTLLQSFLTQLPSAQRNRLSFMGDKALVAAIKKTAPELRAYSIAQGKRCFMEYLLAGWSRYFPPACRHQDLMIPPNYARFLWGWPSQFAARAQANDSSVYLYETSNTYNPNSDLRAQGIGLFTRDLMGLASAKAQQAKVTQAF